MTRRTPPRWAENLARDSMADIIKEETEAYILDKAADLHANLRVEVAVGEDNLPAAVTISGEASPYARRQITGHDRK